MAKEKMNDCVCCPDGCHGCGRDRDYYITVCDICGNDEEVFHYKNGDYCRDCLLNELVGDGIITKAEDEYS